MKLLEEAGLPPGVINFVPGDAAMISTSCWHIVIWPACISPEARRVQLDVEDDRREHVELSLLSAHRRRDRRQGFHRRARVGRRAALSVAIARGGFEYQGQKCSAASRIYVPESLWPEVRDRTVAIMREIKMGDSADFRNFMGAVIDKQGVRRRSASTSTHGRSNAKIDSGRRRDEARMGYFIEPTLVETRDPGYKLLCEEIFGPVVTAHVYPDAKWTRDAGDRRSDLALRVDRRDFRA